MHYDDLNYYSDHRVRAGERRKDSPFVSVDFSRMRAVVKVEGIDDEDRDFEETHEVPVVFAVCPTCEGRGRHVKPSIDAGGLSAEDFDEDPDFRESYMSGMYDVTCYECRGEKVVPRMDEEQVKPEILKAIEERARLDAMYRAERDAERRMGA